MQIKTKKYAPAPFPEKLHDGSAEFELIVQDLLNELAIEHELSKLRRERRMSQAEVAELAGLQQPHIAKLESGGNKNIEIKTLVRVAAALGASVEIRIVPNARVARLMRQPRAAGKTSAKAAKQS